MLDEVLAYMEINAMMPESNVVTYVLARMLHRLHHSTFKGSFRKKMKMTYTSLTKHAFVPTFQATKYPYVLPKSSALTPYSDA